MVKNLKVLLVGDNERASYHPLMAVEAPLTETLSTLGNLTVMVGVEALSGDITKYDCIVIYSDDWESIIPSDSVRKLHDYIDEGGSILFLHAGVSIARTEGMTKLSGAQFKEHPDMAPLTFTVKETSPIKDSIGSFKLYEEPYIYDYDASVDIDIFMTYSYESKDYPSGWLNKSKKGKAITLHPGHNRKVFESKVYQRLIQNCIQYMSALSFKRIDG